jgi:hypothetical protein
MDGFSDTDGAGYITTASGEFYGYPIKTSVPGWVEVEVPQVPPFDWGVGGWPDCVAGSQIGLRDEAGFAQRHYNSLTNHGPPHIPPESMSLATSYGVQTQSCSYPLFPEGHQWTAGWDVQSSPFNVAGWEGYPANAVAPGVSAVVPIPNSSKFFFLYGP